MNHPVRAPAAAPGPAGRGWVAARPGDRDGRDPSTSELSERAYDRVVQLAHRQRAFTSDDAWDTLDPGEHDDRRAIANAFIRAERAGVVANSGVGVYVRGRQAHRRWVAVWLSQPLGASLADASDYANQILTQRAARGASSARTAVP